jgi:NADH-quinone oxidoreductase subunit M
MPGQTSRKTISWCFDSSRTLIIGAAYTLWMIKRVLYGKVANENVAKLEDINRREFLFLAILAAAVLIVGIWPNPLLEVMHTSVENLVQHASISKL